MTHTPDVVGDWIEWHGGENPVGDTDVVEYRLRSGDVYTDPAGALFWPHTVEGHDIIAYRLVSCDGSEGVSRPTPPPDREEIVGVLRALADAYECLCGQAGMNYHESPSSHYARARSPLAKLEPTNDG